MCVLCNSNVVFPCIIYNININEKDSAVQCDICQFCIYLKCKKRNHIDFKYPGGYNNPWYCISCCDENFPFGTLSNNNFLSFAKCPPYDCFSNSGDTYVSKRVFYY